MNLTGLNLASLMLIGSFVAGSSFALEPPPSPAPPPPPAPFFMPGPGTEGSSIPPVEKLATGEYRLGEILVNKAQRSITFPAQVNMDSGLLEYLIVHNKGKTHESLLRTLIDPYNLQIAFLLLGYEGAEQRLTRQGDPATPKGERIRITISTVGGEKKSAAIPAEQWLVNKFGDEVKDVEPIVWVFSGSYVDQGRFLAQESGSIAAIWHDPVALIDNASPGGESNRIWYVKQGKVPPVGTPVNVTIRPAH